MFDKVKQKRAPAGHSYNNVCSRSCYLINKNYQWVYCECIKKARERVKKENSFVKIPL